MNSNAVTMLNPIISPSKPPNEAVKESMLINNLTLI